MPPALEGDWRRDGYLIARGLYTPARAAALLAVAEGCRRRWMFEANPEWGGTGGPQPVGSPSPTPAQLATQRSMRHLNHPHYYKDGARDPGFRTLMEAIADPAVRLPRWRAAAGAPHTTP